MLIYELILLEDQKKIKGHTKRSSNSFLMNTVTVLDNLKLELWKLQEIYKTLDLNINNYLTNEVLLPCFYMERDHLYKSYNIYKDTDIISNGLEITEVTNEFVTTSRELKAVIDKIIKRLESKANETPLKKIAKIKGSKFYGLEA